jgi:glycosyltransferase involved in cell wall biosynthesis
MSVQTSTIRRSLAGGRSWRSKPSLTRDTSPRARIQRRDTIGVSSSATTPRGADSTTASLPPAVDACVKRLDAVYSQARYIIPKTRDIYGLAADPGFLPNPVKVPEKQTKPSEPTVCFLGRFDAEKRPEAFFELAEEFPEVRFVDAGKAHDARRDEALRRKYGGIRNLELPGFLDSAEKGRLLSESWVLVNTSVSECLPVSFLEAAAQVAPY